MAISLKKNEGLSLKKINSDTALEQIAIGLGWSPAKRKTVEKKKEGFFSRIFGCLSEEDSYQPEPPAIDLDASCLCYNDSGYKLDQVWFRQLISSDGAIRHSGDNRHGADSVDAETITINLSKLNPQITKLVFTINSFTGQTFDSIGDITCNLYDLKKGKTQIANYSESVTGSSTAVIVCKIEKLEGDWKITAIAKTCNGRTIQDMASPISSIL